MLYLLFLLAALGFLVAMIFIAASVERRNIRYMLGSSHSRSRRNY